VLTVAVCAGCYGGDRVWGSQRIAIRLAGGAAQVLVFSCASEPLPSLISVSVHDVRAPVDVPIWQVTRRSAGPAPTETVDQALIGQPVAGFEVATPLARPLPTAALDVTVSRQKPSGVVQFRTEELRTDQVRVDPVSYGGHQLVSLAEFYDANRTDCPTR
jgi:hypothetical protein